MTNPTMPPPALPTRNLYLFSDESLSKLNYRMIGPTLVPGHVGSLCCNSSVTTLTLISDRGHGGKDRFRPLDLRENFYTESEANSIGLLDSGMMRYRPPFLRVGREKDKLYHPVKPLSSTLREKISRQCHRWLPSSLVQMLKKMRNTSSAQL